MYDAKSFIFNGKSSDDYDIMICFFDAPEYNTGLQRETLHSERSIARNKTKYYGSKYSNGIEFKFSITKKCIGEFTEEESTIINEWLTGNDTPTLLHFNSCNSIFVNYYAVCVNIEDRIINGRNAKTLTFETNSPFAYSNVCTKTLEVNGEINTTIFSNSCERYYYPIIKIYPKSASDIIIENMTDNNSMTINPSNYTNGIIIDSENCRVTDINNNLISVDLIGWSNDYSSVLSDGSSINSIYFPRLLRGINKFKITGNCKVEFVLEFPRKVGSI